MALQYDQIDAHVRAKYLPLLVDNVFIGNPLLVKLMSKNKIMYDSGATIRVPILYGKKKGGSYSGLDRFDINPVKTRNVAEFNWKFLYTNITIIGEDFLKIEGDEKIIGLVANEIKEAEMKMKDMMSEMLVASTTGNGSKDLTSLQDIIGTGAYGGITPSDLGSNSTNLIWQSYVATSQGAITLAKVKNYIGYTTWGTEVPDLIFTEQTLYDALWAQVQPEQRFLSPQSVLAKVGFTGIQIDNTQILVDRHLTGSGMMLGMNTDYLRFLIHKKRNFDWTENKNLVDADAYVRQLLFAGEIFATARRYHFKATGLTA